MSLPTWYVYYKVAPAQAATLLPLVQAMQAELAQRLQVQARLQQGLDLSNDAPALLTWMEIYQESTDSQVCMQGRKFPHWLTAAVDATAISACLEGARHIECFMEVSLCA